MSRLTDLLSQLKASNPELGKELEREFKTLSSRLSFGLNFERHLPETVELPGRPIRKGDKVRVLPPRGATQKGDKRLWKVLGFAQVDGQRAAQLELTGAAELEKEIVLVEDLVVVAEFRDYIYPGLVSTGKIQRGGDKPYHTVINGENFHALETLTFTHRGKIDAIYIDPPYNTRDKDWKYNNDYVDTDDLYRHSKWLAMMERRMQIAKELLKPTDSVLIITIDEKEYLRLGLLLEQVFSGARIQMISINVNPAAASRAGAFGRSDEYIFFVMQGSSPTRLLLDRDWVSVKGRTHTGAPRWDLLRRSGSGASRQDSPGCFYPIYVDTKTPSIVKVGEPLPNGTSVPPPVDGAIAILPIRKDGSEGRWMMTSRELRSRIPQGRVRINVSKNGKKVVLYYLADGEFKKIEAGEFTAADFAADGSMVFAKSDSEEVGSVLAIPSTQWRIASHDSTQYGTRLLADFVPDRKFPYPKSLYAVEDTIRFFVKEKPEAVILDYFAGSGTTAHAVARLNRQDGGRRQCISITNNEVAADEHEDLWKSGLRPGDPEWETWGICEYITKPRIQAAITGKTPEGKSIKGDYKFTDEFPMSEGFEENAEFFTLTYETPVGVGHNRAYARIAPLLWIRAGSTGRRIEKLPELGWDVADTYGLLIDLDQASAFSNAVTDKGTIRIAFIVTDDDRRFQSIARRLPNTVEPIRLYESYLTNFRFSLGQ